MNTIQEGDSFMTLHGLYGNPTNPTTGSTYVNDGKKNVWSWQNVDQLYTGPK